MKWLSRAATVLFAYLIVVGYAQAGATPVYILDNSVVVSQANISNALPALQASISKDFAPAWNADAQLVLLPNGAKPPAGAWTITVTDDVDCLGCYGYHDLSNGVPFAKVFPDLSYPWTVTFDHETKEMLADPLIDRALWDGFGTVYLAEVSDPVEGLNASYYRHGVNGVPVPLSDFVFESWYRSAGDPPYDFTGRVKRPGQLLRDGYVSFWLRGWWRQKYSP